MATNQHPVGKSDEIVHDKDNIHIDLNLIPLKKQVNVIWLSKVLTNTWLLEKKTGISEIYIWHIIEHQAEILKRWKEATSHIGQTEQETEVEKNDHDAVHHILMEWAKRIFWQGYRAIEPNDIEEMANQLKKHLLVPKFRIRSEFWEEFIAFKLKELDNYTAGNKNNSLDIVKILKDSQSQMNSDSYKRFLSILKKRAVIRSFRNLRFPMPPSEQTATTASVVNIEEPKETTNENATDNDVIVINEAVECIDVDMERSNKQRIKAKVIEVATVCTESKGIDDASLFATSSYGNDDEKLVLDVKTEPEELLNEYKEKVPEVKSEKEDHEMTEEDDEDKIHENEQTTVLTKENKLLTKPKERTKLLTKGNKLPTKPNEGTKPLKKENKLIVNPNDETKRMALTKLKEMLNSRKDQTSSSKSEEETSWPESSKETKKPRPSDNNKGPQQAVAKRRKVKKTKTPPSKDNKKEEENLDMEDDRNEHELLDSLIFEWSTRYVLNRIKPKIQPCIIFTKVYEWKDKLNLPSYRVSSRVLCDIMDFRKSFDKRNRSAILKSKVRKSMDIVNILCESEFCVPSSTFLKFMNILKDRKASDGKLRTYTRKAKNKTADASNLATVSSSEQTAPINDSTATSIDYDVQQDLPSLKTLNVEPNVMMTEESLEIAEELDNYNERKLLQESKLHKQYVYSAQQFTPIDDSRLLLPDIEEEFECRPKGAVDHYKSVDEYQMPEKKQAKYVADTNESGAQFEIREVEPEKSVADTNVQYKMSEVKQEQLDNYPDHDGDDDDELLFSNQEIERIGYGLQTKVKCEISEENKATDDVFDVKQDYEEEDDNDPDADTKCHLKNSDDGFYWKTAERDSNEEYDDSKATEGEIDDDENIPMDFKDKDDEKDNRGIARSNNNKNEYTAVTFIRELENSFTTSSMSKRQSQAVASSDGSKRICLDAKRSRGSLRSSNQVQTNAIGTSDEKPNEISNICNDQSQDEEESLTILEIVSEEEFDDGDDDDDNDVLAEEEMSQSVVKKRETVETSLNKRSENDLREQHNSPIETTTFQTVLMNTSEAVCYLSKLKDFFKQKNNPFGLQLALNLEMSFIDHD